MQSFKFIIPCILSAIIATFLIRDPLNFQFSTGMIYFYSSIPFGWYVLNRLFDQYQPPDVFITIETALIIRIIKTLVKFFVSMLFGFIVSPFVIIYGIYRVIKELRNKISPWSDHKA